MLLPPQPALPVEVPLAQSVFEADPVVDQRIAGEDEEQQHSLEHASDLVRQSDGDLSRLTAQISQRQHQPRGENADWIEATEERRR